VDVARIIRRCGGLEQPVVIADFQIEAREGRQVEPVDCVRERPALRARSPHTVARAAHGHFAIVWPRQDLIDRKLAPAKNVLGSGPIGHGPAARREPEKREAECQCGRLHQTPLPDDRATTPGPRASRAASATSRLAPIAHDSRVQWIGREWQFAN
jgi:hypothetical protein